MYSDLPVLCLAVLSNPVYIVLLFFVKQKTAYEMRISAWSSDVCSSDLVEAQRQQHVFQHRQPRQQVEALEHEADAAVADVAAGLVVEGGHVAALDPVAAAAGVVEAAEAVAQARLARARGPGDGHELPGGDPQVHPRPPGHGLAAPPP